jgi:flagellar basal-body rod protein FlgB
MQPKSCEPEPRPERFPAKWTSGSPQKTRQHDELERAMPISEIPIFSMLRTRMQWHQERQQLLAENVSNANTPNFKPRDLAPPDFERAQPAAALGVTRTSAAHLAGASTGPAQFQLDRKAAFEVRPAGNAVSLEDEMLKVAANQMDYQTATALYSRGLGLIKTALGVR